MHEASVIFHNRKINVTFIKNQNYLILNSSNQNPSQFQTTLLQTSISKNKMVDESVLNDEVNTPESQSSSKAISLKYKIVIASLFSIGFFVYRLAYKKYIGAACNVDKYHELTYEANRKLYHGWDNTILGIGQLLMDGWVIFMAFYWLWNIKNMRFPMSAGIFFLFRAFLLNTQKFPFPDDIVWHNPGFISITVPYDHTRDFFYSGHTGTLIIISLELWTLNKKTICAVCLVSLLYMINMLTITRIHYSIDVIGAFIFAPFWFFFIQKHLAKVDFGYSVFYYIFRKIYRKCKRDNYDKHGSEAELENKSQGIKNASILKEDKQIDMKIDMNDEITNANDFPYLSEQGDYKKQQKQIEK